MNKKITIPLVLALTIFGIMSLYAVSNIQSGTGVGAVGQPLGVWHGVLCPEVIRADGSREIMPCNHNTVTTAGLNHIQYLLGSGAALANTSVTSFQYLAVGNSTTPAVGNTFLIGEINATNAPTGCGLTRSFGTYTDDPAFNGNWSQNYQWTLAGAGCGGIIVNTTGLFNASTITTGTMLAAGAFSNSVTLQVGDKLNVTYYTWIS